MTWISISDLGFNMHKFVRSLITEWRKLGLPFSGASVVVAVSGGADSMSLMLAIHDLVKRDKLQLRVIVAHLNHRLRGRESDDDEEFVRQQAEKLGFEFVSGTARLAKKGNLEQNARDARYKFLRETAQSMGAFGVIVAHTQNDQAETLLMNLIRGSGPEGLTGMPPVRELDQGILLIRPLLTWATRGDTESFCAERGIQYRLDAMNEDERFTRVRLRKVIMPALAELNPRIVETLARTSRILKPSDDLNGPAGDTTLSIANLRSLAKAELYSQLRAWVRRMRGNLRGLQLKHIEGMERLVLSQRSGKTVELPGGGRVSRHGGRLTYSNIKVEK